MTTNESTKGIGAPGSRITKAFSCLRGEWAFACVRVRRSVYIVTFFSMHHHAYVACVPLASLVFGRATSLGTENRRTPERRIGTRSGGRCRRRPSPPRTPRHPRRSGSAPGRRSPRTRGRLVVGAHTSNPRAGDDARTRCVPRRRVSPWRTRVSPIGAPKVVPRAARRRRPRRAMRR